MLAYAVLCTAELLAPLSDDLAAWRATQAAPPATTRVFPSSGPIRTRDVRYSAGDARRAAVCDRLERLGVCDH